MSTTEFIASLVGALAWPIVILAVALLFRSKIIQLLSTDMKRLKAGPIEVEWERAIAEIELAGVGPVSAEDSLAPGGPTSRAFADLALRDPTIAVSMASRSIDDALFRYLARTIPKEELRTGFAGLIKVATDRNLLPAELTQAMKLLVRLRSMASHAPNALNAEQALEYLQLCDYVIEELK